MKIAFVSQPIDRVLPPKRNSVGIWTAEVARRLAQTNQVIVYIDGGRVGGPPIFHDGVEYRKLRTLPYPLVRKVTKSISKVLPIRKPFFSSIFFSAEFVLQAALDLQREKCDVIHIMNFSQFVPVIRAFNPQSTIVLHMHCEWLSQLDEKMIESRLRQVDLVVGCSEYIMHKVRTRFPHFAEKCEVVYNGVDTGVFVSKRADAPVQLVAGPPKPPRLLFLGRISPEKGAHLLIDALPLVAEKYPNVQVAFIGGIGSVPVEYLIRLSGEARLHNLAQYYQERYIDTIKRRIPTHLREQVFFLGHVAHNEIPDHVCNADVLVNPSLSEAFGMSLIEAMASGTPVVASRVGGMVEIIEDWKNGLLVEPDSAQALADGILCLLNDARLRQRISQAGRERVVHIFAWEPIANRLYELYGQRSPEVTSMNHANPSYKFPF